MVTFAVTKRVGLVEFFVLSMSMSMSHVICNMSVHEVELCLSCCMRKEIRILSSFLTQNLYIFL